MTIKDAKELTEFISNKYQNGNISGDEFNLLFRQAELSYMDFLVGPIEQYQPGRPVPRVGLGMSKLISEALSPFRATIGGAIGASGEMDKPTNVKVVESFNKQDGTNIRFISPEKLGYVLTSEVVPLSASNPIYVEYDTYWRIYPENIGAVVATVIEMPPPSKWAYTLDSDEREIYSSTSSIDPLWKESDMLKIIARLLKQFGVSVKDGELMQYSENIINNGG